jgi:hypothetical protein
LENGLKNIKSYRKKNGSSLLKEFNIELYFFNCLDIMHPVFPTAELSLILKSFDIELKLDTLITALNIQKQLTEILEAKEQ